MRQLKQAVLVGGIVLPTGTAWSKDLADKVPADLWSGSDPEPEAEKPSEEPVKAPRRTSRSKSEK